MEQHRAVLEAKYDWRKNRGAISLSGCDRKCSAGLELSRAGWEVTSHRRKGIFSRCAEPKAASSVVLR